MTDTEARVIKLIRKKAHQFENRQTLAVREFSDEHLLEAMARADLHYDSLDMIEHVMAVEEEFKVEITDDEADLASEATVRQWAGFIDAKLTAAAALAKAALAVAHG